MIGIERTRSSTQNSIVTYKERCLVRLLRCRLVRLVALGRERVLFGCAEALARLPRAGHTTLWSRLVVLVQPTSGGSDLPLAVEQGVAHTGRPTSFANRHRAPVYVGLPRANAVSPFDPARTRA